jgi:hypothetical protein
MHLLSPGAKQFAAYQKISVRIMAHYANPVKTKKLFFKEQLND